MSLLFPKSSAGCCAFLACLLVGPLWAAAPALAATNSPGYEGQPFLQYYSPLDYHASSPCHGIAQDARGILYVGNLGVVLEYDGSTWRQIPVGSNRVWSLTYDAATDRVFVGTTNDLGYLETRPGGGRAFVSLLGQLPAGTPMLGNVRGVHATPAGVFFLTDHQVLRWREGRFTVWPLAEPGPWRGGWAAGHLFVHNPGGGLLRLEDERFVPACTDPLLNRAVVHAVAGDARGRVFVGTEHDGLFILRDGALVPWGGALVPFLKEQGIYRLRALRDGSLAVATQSAGLVLLDPEGRFRVRVDRTAGMHGNNLLDLFEDAEDGLWVGLEAGITRAEVSSPLSILRGGPDDDLSNVETGDYCLGSMVLGTSSALYRLAAADPAAGAGAHLELLPGTVDYFTSTAAVDNGLLLAARGKVVLLGPDGRLTLVLGIDSPVLRLLPSRARPGRVYVAENNGHIGALRLDGATQKWVRDETVSTEVGQSDLNGGIAESPRGDLWLGSSTQGLFRVQLPTADRPAAVTSFLQEPGPLHGQPFVLAGSDGGPVSLMTADRLYRLDERGDGVRLATEFRPALSDGSFHLDSMLIYDATSLWVVGNAADAPTGEKVYGRELAAAPGRPAVFQPLPHKIESVVGRVLGYIPMETAPQPMATLLVLGSGGNGVVRLDVARWDAALATPRPFATLVRRAVTVNGHPGASEPPPILADALPYARNSVHFEYAAGTFAFGAAPRFQTRLAGLGDSQWSDFSDRSSADYFNLPEGGYTFEVRARNADGQLGSVASMPFRVLPPWQRTWWAYALYALALAAVVYALLRWRLWRLHAQNVRLERLIEERTGELRHARDAAESANRAKSAFLANMTHELRTPLNAILGYSQIMLKDRELSARNRERVVTMDRSGNHLLSMINEVLDLSKIEAGKLALLPTPFSLEALLDDLCAAFRPRFAENGVEFECVRASGLPAVIHTDAGKLRQVLFNLLGNALKFTRQGRVQLEVETASAADTVRFAVADTGVGIAPEELRDIFLAFHQAGDHQAARQGTGLGLSISQRLVELLGGRLQVESTPGTGSRFWFELHLPPVAATGALLTGRTAELAGRPVVGYHGPRRRLLIVDDEAVNRQVLIELLAPLGFEMEEAPGGAEGLRRCAEHPPDALLLDLRMGGMGGLEVARTLRRQGGAGAAIRIVAVSASVFSDDRQGAIDAGCDDFLPKPFKEEQLLAVLGRLLGLEWITAGEADTPAQPGVAVVDGEKFTREIDALIDLAHAGDILGLKTRFAALRDAGGIPEEYRALAGQLEPLLAGYEVDRVHALLVKFKQHANV